MRHAIAGILAVILLSSCASIIEGERRIVETHISQQSPQTVPEAVRAADYEGIYDAVASLIALRQYNGKVHVYEYTGEATPDSGGDVLNMLIADTERVCRSLPEEDAFASFSVENISAEVQQIVTYYEVSITITYKRSKEQMDSVVPVSTDRYLRTEMLSALSTVQTETLIITSLPDLTAESIVSIIEEQYYANPGSAIMLPVVTVSVYPDETALQKLFEITLEYDKAPSVLKANAELLMSTIGTIVRLASGVSDKEILESLVTRLGEIATYDRLADTLQQYSKQDYASTAYGALQARVANSEGYALAFKALCDELRLTCVAVRGARGGREYVWNIVTVKDGAEDVSYHIDPAMCDDRGMDGYFLKSDRTMAIDGYVWDRTSYPVCLSDWKAPAVTPEPSMEPDTGASPSPSANPSEGPVTSPAEGINTPAPSYPSPQTSEEPSVNPSADPRPEPSSYPMVSPTDVTPTVEPSVEQPGAGNTHDTDPEDVETPAPIPPETGEEGASSAASDESGNNGGVIGG